MMPRILTSLVAHVLVLAGGAGLAAGEAAPLPFADTAFPQQVQHRYTVAEGLPSDEVLYIAIDPAKRIVVETTQGTAYFAHDRWHTDRPAPPATMRATVIDRRLGARLEKVAGLPLELRDVARHADETAVAADQGLYLHDGQRWRLVLPQAGSTRWAPVDVRAVAYDADGRLWFAAPQGAGCRLAEGEWKLFTGENGLPYNNFTCMTTGADGSVWFGTTNGAIRYHDGAWNFRQGGRWLLDNHVRDIAVDAEGNAWIATAKGVSCIATMPMTLAQKAAYFEDEIEKYHRRTSFGFVNPAVLDTPGDKSTATPRFTDNEGVNSGLYLGAVGLAYAATGDPVQKKRAANTFRALAFLSEVTQGGTHPAPKGFIARTIVPTAGPDPNPDFDLDYDIGRNQRDTLWKIIQPRWPIDETGEWYWKNDSSTDELDGHFFGYGIYYDRVCETEAEREEVRRVVRRVMDHVLDHGYNLVDWDGKPTRWGHMSPDDLNRNEAWVAERGLNAYSILTYLSVAHHITGDAKYRKAYRELALDHGYGMNGMTQPRDIAGVGTHGQPDDNMAFMNYYHLIRYETDPKLLSMYYRAIQRHWQIEQYERNAHLNFVYAACVQGKTRTDQWGTDDLSLPPQDFAIAIDELRRYPLDLIDWPMSNAHRIDGMRLRGHLDQKPASGHHRNGYVYPVDERAEVYWDREPWALTSSGDGTRLREGFHYLLAYYMGRAHGFLSPEQDEQ